MSTISEAIRQFAGAGGRSDRELVRASWNGAVIAQSARTIKLEGNHYLPPEDVRLGVEVRPVPDEPAPQEQAA